MIRTLLLTAAISSLMVSGALSQSAKGGAGDSPKFVASQSPDQWVFSKFKGTDVIGPNDESIGDVNDLLFDKTGKVVGVIVGVGGFLGIGQKNVAIEMNAFQVVSGGTGSNTTTAPVTNAPPTNEPISRAPVTGRIDDPTYVKLKVTWTKDQLKQAPDFKYYKPPSGSASNGGSPATTGIGQRPGPMAPSPARP